MRPTALLSLLTLPLLALTAPAQVTDTIPNDLQLSWPNDLTYLEASADQVKNTNTIAITTEQLAEPLLRPGQVQPIDGRDTVRVWFLATIEHVGEGRGHAPASATVELRPGDAVASPLSIETHDDHYLIRNGPYDYRLRRYPSKFASPIALGDVPHWQMGAKPAGAAAWDGRAYFDGSSRVVAANTQIIAQGPVFIDAKITYTFAEPGEDGTTDALPMALGKQTHTWAPNRPPRQTIPKQARHLTVLIRFVAGDPWIEVNERFHLPPDESVPGFGIHQQWFHWGQPPADFPHDKVDLPAESFVELDTASWVRWFEYDKFGGNTNQHDVPLEPRPAQKGRPFALLRPRWHQGGGGAQDFVAWRGGPKPHTDKKTGQRVQAEHYSPEAPAFGIVAAFASKWVGPYPNTIAAYAYDGRRAVARLPLRDGDTGRSGMHYGQRSYALLVGPRKQFHHLNDIVRRHTDWTLLAQHHHYILDWPRDPDLAGPNILITGQRLNDLRQQYADGSNPALVELVDETRAERDALRERLKQAEDADEKQKIRDLRKKLDRTDFKVLRLILGEEAGGAGLPDVGLWLQRRYQDDFLNPTSHTTRKLNEMIPMADLFAGGKPIGGKQQAAIGYVFTDLDHWPGYHHGWSPGNPNFHTDKYMPAAMIGAAMRDHPHSDRWLAFGYDNFIEDLGKVFLPPDGVGYECPGYAGYSMNLQIDTARLFFNAGFGNAMADNPLVAKSAEWHRLLITPVDPRLDRRHEAPIGDTHRWDAGLKAGFGKLAVFFREKDPDFASKLLGTMSLINPGKDADSFKTRVLEMDPSIKPMNPDDMDWTSRTFFGFGAIMRDKFGADQETFLSFKAGPARGHAHNEELSWHFHANGTPISLDYNCSYDPRMDHAAMHNSMTFGKTGQLRHNRKGHAYEAMEELGATGHVGAFAATDVADVVVAERRGNALVMRPHDPQHVEFGRQYPARDTGPLVHRRFVALVKHPAGGPMPDYLVVRDETRSDQPQQINVHLLGREAEVSGHRVRATGQWDKDILIHFADARDLNIEQRSGWYFDEWQSYPEQVLIRPGESQAAWAERFAALDLPDNRTDMVFVPRGARDKGDFDRYFERIRQTDGKALMPPPGWEGTWQSGEYQLWLRCHTAPGSSALWVMVPYDRGGPEPTIETRDDGTAIRVSVGDASEVIAMPGTGHAVTLTRDGRTTTLLDADALPPLGEIPAGRRGRSAGRRPAPRRGALPRAGRSSRGGTASCPCPGSRRG